jgi:hypothetical protein
VKICFIFGCDKIIIVSKIRKLTQIFGHLGKDFPIYFDKDCLINLKKHRVKTISAENFTQIGFRGFGKNYKETPSSDRGLQGKGLINVKLN